MKKDMWSKKEELDFKHGLSKIFGWLYDEVRKDNSLRILFTKLQEGGYSVVIEADDEEQNDLTLITCGETINYILEDKRTMFVKETGIDLDRDGFTELIKRMR